MHPPTPPGEQCHDKGLGKLIGLSNWHVWHMKARMALQTRGLRYLLDDDGPPEMPDDFDQYDADRASGVGLLVDAMSEDVLERAYRRGWKPEHATVTDTLNTLDAIFSEEQQAQRNKDERAKVLRRRLVDLSRMDLGADAQTVREYILAAKHNHDALLVHYGDSNPAEEGCVSPAEELLEQLFVTSVIQGLRTARPSWYAEWMEKMAEGTLGSAGSRPGVTEWLMGKDKADQEERDAAAAAAAVVASRPLRRELALDSALPSKPAAHRPPPPKRAKNTIQKSLQGRCSYCAYHHPLTEEHSDEGCWYRQPHKAPLWWQRKFRDEIERESWRRDGKRKRSPSPLTSMRCL
ncbi:hypothetical protein ISF_04870 [Cordyceps fumosorosea ARSEF 2679]|uniref:Uncharacterized protein n=1 Tax=Cordyceps fumosorosea (strain ARSEF 2679) TaxID=1081104 RepID=A0A167VUK2_CORFA|nr:hypothetical protein ISF_04870 [Cordyceps fumosorosea ARSEF 2679]OAA62994.1 hypothetical protein ISF_04870 [Cordyceps fumosorosea ARSEF 2679]